MALTKQQYEELVEKVLYHYEFENREHFEEAVIEKGYYRVYKNLEELKQDFEEVVEEFKEDHGREPETLEEFLRGGILRFESVFEELSDGTIVMMWENP
jgi:hypothetical protein